MRSDELKAYLNLCHDKTDLPTTAMIEAGAQALDEGGWLGNLVDPELLQQVAAVVWGAMITELKASGRQPTDYAKAEGDIWTWR